MESEPPCICPSYCDLADAGYAKAAVLGQGAYGTVHRCTRGGVQFAVKNVRKGHGRRGKSVVEMVGREVEIMGRVQGHRNVLGFVELLENEASFDMVMELVEGEELLQRLAAGGREHEAWSEGDARRLLRDVCAALSHCHDRCVIHRDVKPANLMFASRAADAPVKLIDFGAALVFDPARPPTESVGTVRYMAPEVLSKQPYGPAVDAWSVGCIAHLLLTGEDAFPQTSGVDLRIAIAASAVDWSSDRWKHVSDDAMQLCRSLVALRADGRPSPAAALSHTWMVASDSRVKRASLPRVRGEAGKTLHLRRLRRAVREIIRANRSGKELQEVDVCSPRYHPSGSFGEEEAAGLQQQECEGGEGIDESPAFAAIVQVAEELHRRGEKLKPVFARMDVNGDGGVDAGELVAGLRDAGIALTHSGAGALISEFDRNGDQLLQYHEFVRMIAGCQQRAEALAAEGGRPMSGLSRRCSSGGVPAQHASSLSRAEPSSAHSGRRSSLSLPQSPHCQSPAQPASPADYGAAAPPEPSRGGAGAVTADRLSVVAGRWPKARPAFEHLAEGGRQISARQLAEGVTSSGGSLSVAEAEELVSQYSSTGSLGLAAFTRLFAAACPGP